MMLLWMLACTTTIQFPPDLFPRVDSGLQTGLPTPVIPTSIWGTIDDASVNVECAGVSELAIAFRTIGWADGASALIVNSATGHAELHTFARMDVHPGGDWETYQVGPLGDAGLDWEDGLSTQLSCPEDAGVLTIAVLPVSRLGGYADCLAIGVDLAALGVEIEAIAPGVFQACRLSTASF